jgi:hypothetical protein
MMSTLIREAERDKLTLRLMGLVHVRALLETRGAAPTELTVYSDGIARLRTELARLADSEQPWTSA